uniref:Uncharacterized protein n=1 Tax=Arundo donax TaxID=35708 RepID=A0A0A9B3N5_ARUDO
MDIGSSIILETRLKITKTNG